MAKVKSDEPITIPQPRETWKNVKDHSYFTVVEVHDGYVRARWQMGTTVFKWKVGEFTKLFRRVG